MAVNIKKFSSSPIGGGQVGAPLVYNYGYDQLNRLISMDAFDGWQPQNNNIFQPNKLQDYKERVSYDGNGNILTYERNGQASSSGLLMDKLTYQYERTTDGRLHSNKLRYVHDDVQGNSYGGDLKTGTSLNLLQVQEDKNTRQGSDNYDYDAIGNLIKDTKEGITAITWTVYGKIATITKANGQTIAYTYDAGGNRISKTVSKADTTTNTWYVRDAQGNVMSIYSEKNSVLSLSEQHLYGSSRLGVWNHKVNMDEVLPTPTNASGIGIVNTTTFDRGNKFFELSNHLGNVLVTVSDKKIAVPSPGNSSLIDYYTADVLSAQDYYPFGMTMPGRRGSLTRSGLWQGTGSNSLSAHLYISNRTGNTPSEYKATQDIEFTDGFESGEGDNFEALITTATDGGGSSNVADGESGYRYGFNGKENDPETSGDGNQYDYGFRIYNPRLGRFLSVDPLTQSYPWYTPYQFAGNMPIWAVDLDGLEEKKSTSFSDIQTQTFIRMGQEWQIKSKIANEIYGAINQKIRSREGDYKFRTFQEEGVIKSEIQNHIVVGLDDNRAAIKHPETNEPSIIYKFAKTTFNFLTGEALPVTLSVGGKGAFEVGSLLTRVSANVESYQTNFYKKYFPEKFAKATAINSTALKAGGTLTKGIGTVLKVGGKLLNIAGTVTMMYDVINAGSPGYVGDEDFRKWTRNEIKKYLDLQANQSSSSKTGTTTTTSQTTTSNTSTATTDKKTKE